MARETANFKITYFITFLLLLGWFNGFSQKDSLDSSVYISGKIIDADTSKKLTFRFYKNYLTFEELNYTASIKNDSFFIEIPIQEHTPGFIAYGGLNVPIFLEKGDSFFVESYGVTFIDSLIYRGKGALPNNYLKQTYLEFDSKDIKRVEESIVQNTAKGYQVLMKKFKQNKIDFLDNYLVTKDTLFTKVFNEYVRADINYWFGHNLMRYRSEHPASDVLPIPLTLSDDYFGFMDSLEINKESALSNVNYLTYIDHYAKWREERIAKGLFKFKNVSKTKKELVKINMIETFAHVLMNDLEVRSSAHDENTVIAKLARGVEVLYMQDVTNDRFSYPYQGHRYIDKFLKVELKDGRSGWVFKGGIRLEEKIVYAKKWVEVPNTSPEAMQHFKYANFKGKVLHYAVAKDLYWDALNGDKSKKKLIEGYIEKLPNDEYTATLREALTVIKKEVDSNSIVANKVNPIQISKLKKLDTLTTTNLLKEITAVSAQHLQIKNRKETTTRSLLHKAIVIDKPDFTVYQKLTRIKGFASYRALSRPELLVNTNPLLNEPTSFPFEDKADANFKYDISLKSSTTAELKMGKESIDLYLTAGDDLQITINGNDLYSQTVFSGNGSKVNNYLVAAANTFKKKNQELEVKIRYADPTEFKAFLAEVRQEKLAFLSKYLESNTLKTNIIKYVKADIDYWYAFNLMNYPYEHPIFHEQSSPMAVPEDYYDFMEKIPINNSNALPNKQYFYYLQAYLGFKAGSAENKGLNRLAIADKYLKGKPLYFFKANQLSIEAKRNVDPRIKEKVLDFVENCPYKLYGEFVKLAYHEGIGIIEGIDAPDFTLADIDGNMVSLSDYRGKVVFLDFWATWCVPCIHQLPSHEKLQRQFNGQEVVFLYVSVDKNKNKWTQFVRNKKLPGVHFSGGSKMFQSTIAKDYKVSSLPYTLLIDPEGKIVWHHTGAYSVKDLGGRISELLH